MSRDETPEGPVLVDDDAGLAALSDKLARAPWVAIAAELNATRSYRPRICLIQLDVAGEVVALDPLAFVGRRPDPVAAALARISGTIIVHGGEYLVAAFTRELHLSLTRLIDTQQAAVLLGLPATGLRSLCSQLGFEVPGPQSVDWSLRPLPRDLVQHALADVRHLHALYVSLMAKIAAADLEDELALASAPAPLPSFVLPDTPDPRRYRQIEGASGLPPEALQLLGALVRWRDLKAKELDVPPGRLLPNAQLVDLAHAPERALQRLSGMRFHSRLVHADLEALRRVVALALASEPEAPDPKPARGKWAKAAQRLPSQYDPTPKKGPPTPAIKARLARLKAWRRGEAEARGVGLQAVMPLVALEHLAYFPTTPLAQVPSFGTRRTQRYAAKVAELLRT